MKNWWINIFNLGIINETLDIVFYYGIFKEINYNSRCYHYRLKVYDCHQDTDANLVQKLVHKITDSKYTTQ